jgi:DMSO/TMAO reductase YedYZ molybdopterin-dependent catalytic subunit
MDVRLISRRDALIQTGSTLAALAFFQSPLFAWGREGEKTIPFLDQPTAPPPPLQGLNQLDWQSLDSWITPNEKFFHVGHYGVPQVDAGTWKLEIGGRVARPQSYGLSAIKSLPKKDVVFALECSGNSGFPFLQGAIGNARWTGTPLAAVLQKAGRKPDGVEVVFYGADQGEEPIPYIGGLGDKMGDFKAKAPFARSMSWSEAVDPANLLCYEMNGQPLPAANGFPLRLIAPRWFGISNVKWLTRIEVTDSRFEGPFQAQRYMTVRELPRDDGTTVWTRTAVGRSLLKSIPAMVTVQDGKYRIYGAAWGAPIARVEIRVDDGPWKTAAIDRGAEHEFAWKFWHLDWANPAAGEHKITSRAIDKTGGVQPAMDDPLIAKKHTYWEANGQITRMIRIS